jgi:hypothetical protein
MIPLELKKLRKVGRSTRLLGAVTAADAPSASVLSVSEEPDQGSGADAGVRPTTKYVTNRFLAVHITPARCMTASAF